MSPPRKREAPLPFARAAERYGFGKGQFAVRRFSRYVFAAQRALGEKLIIVRGTPKLPRYYVTDEIVRRLAPELFPRRDMVAEELREHVEKTEEALDDLRERDVEVAKRLVARIDEAAATIRRQVAELSARVARLEAKR